VWPSDGWQGGAGRAIAVSGNMDKTIRVWDLVTGKQIGGSLTDHDDHVSAVALGSLNGRPIVVSGGSSRYVAGDFALRVWDLELPKSS
jgi:WD40 repeat protein